jgi:membrane protein YdbS with pleckstrin-like domain
LAAGKRFCADCGQPAEDPELTRLARPAPGAVDADEPVIFVARPTLLYVKAGYALAALGSVGLAALLAWLPPLLIGWSLPWYVWLPLALSIFLWPAYRHFKRNLVRYTLTASKIEIDEGFIARTTRNVPLSKVQDVTVTAGFVQRLLGYGDLVIDNASEQGGNIVMRNIADPRRHADLLLRQLRQRS